MAVDAGSAADLAAAGGPRGILSAGVTRRLGRTKAVAPSIDAITVMLTEEARRAAKAAHGQTIENELLPFREVPFPRRLRRRLLTCGIVASALWVGTDALAGTLAKDYSFVAQASSDLSAPGAPTRSLMVVLNLTYDALMVAFALGVWGSDEKRALRLTAVMVAGNAVLGALALVFFPWHPDEPTRAPANTMNVAVMASSMVCFLLAMAFGAVAFRNWFRLYSIGTLAAYGALTILGIALGSRDGERASVGIQERTMVLGYLLWVVVLAIALLRAETRLNQSGD